MALNGTELLEYACMKFQEEKYDEALDAFVLAYSKGSEQEWILENIYNCYVEGNEAEFRKTYEQFQEKTGIAYEDCLLEFIPYNDGEYYVFDTEQKLFLRKISVRDLEDVERQEIFQKAEFSGAVVLMDWNWGKKKDVLAEAKERNIYVICQDLRRCSSYYKIPELAAYFQHVRLFSSPEQFQVYFHTHTAEYLPKIVLGDEINAQYVTNIINEEHLYRLTPEGRNTENVLLTIAIPTYGRGNLLLKRIENLLQMTYDAEVEIVISKNGTTYYEEEYAVVSKIADARINYFDHGKVLKYYENWRYAVEMSKGEFVLLVSDEDNVRLENLEHYFKLLSDNPRISLMRARTDKQYGSLTERVYCEKGKEAFKQAFLRQNYLSGLIVKKKIFSEENFFELDRFAENIFYNFYAHEWWCTALCMKGDYLEEPVSLISEGDSKLEEEVQRDNRDGVIIEATEKTKETIFPEYSTYKARLAQFDGQIAFLNWFCGSNEELKMAGLNKAVNKLAYLFLLARSYHYDSEHFVDWVDEFARSCMKVIDELVYEDLKPILLQDVYKNCMDLLNYHYNLLGAE